MWAGLRGGGRGCRACGRGTCAAINISALRRRRRLLLLRRITVSGGYLSTTHDRVTTTHRCTGCRRRCGGMVTRRSVSSGRDHAGRTPVIVCTWGHRAEFRMNIAAHRSAQQWQQQAQDRYSRSQTRQDCCHGYGADAIAETVVATHSDEAGVAAAQSTSSPLHHVRHCPTAPHLSVQERTSGSHSHRQMGIGSLCMLRARHRDSTGRPRARSDHGSRAAPTHRHAHSAAPAALAVTRGGGAWSPRPPRRCCCLWAQHVRRRVVVS
jgi:hypothetical protein